MRAVASFGGNISKINSYLWVCGLTPRLRCVAAYVRMRAVKFNRHTPLAHPSPPPLNIVLVRLQLYIVQTLGKVKAHTLGKNLQHACFVWQSKNISPDEPV